MAIPMVLSAKEYTALKAKADSGDAAAREKLQQSNRLQTERRRARQAELDAAVERAVRTADKRREYERAYRKRKRTEAKEGKLEAVAWVEKRKVSAKRCQERKKQISGTPTAATEFDEDRVTAVPKQRGLTRDLRPRRDVLYDGDSDDPITED